MKKRLITSAVVIVFALFALAFHNTPIFSIVVAFVMELSVYELLTSTKIMMSKTVIIGTMIFSAALPFYPYLPDVRLFAAWGMAYAVFIIVNILLKHEKTDVRQLWFALSFGILVPLSLSCLSYLNNIYMLDERYNATDGLFFAIFGMSVAWIADAGALFAGKLFGKHKLAPEISPKKTVEGAIGGLVCNVIVFTALGIVWQAFFAEGGRVNIILLAALSVVLGVLSIIGDLIFSFIKRETGIKDYGWIMPGHGGMMDRMDSVFMTAPVSLLLIEMFPIIVR